MENSLLLLASMFAQRGGWSADRQFFDLIGSTCLLAHGLGEPVADASTTCTIASGEDITSLSVPEIGLNIGQMPLHQAFSRCLLMGRALAFSAMNSPSGIGSVARQ